MTHTWMTARGPLTWGPKPLLMGILNVTPDSFSDGGRFLDPDAALAQARFLAEAGAGMLDIGGESTRPGAAAVPAGEETARILPVLKPATALGIPLSVDTTKAAVARQALEHGAAVINDVSGGEWDPELWRVLADCNAGYVLTHCQGRPPTMQHAPAYADVVAEVRDYLARRLEAADAAGIAPGRIVLDPGFGFGKTAAHNWELLDHLDALVELERPVLVGISRKAFLRRVAGEENVETSTLLAHACAALKGAAILRVHDVTAARTALTMTDEPEGT